MLDAFPLYRVRQPFDFLDLPPIFWRATQNGAKSLVDFADYSEGIE
jgi:hypothetical protein